MNWKVSTLNPSDMMEPYGIVSREIPNGTLAGSIGQKKNAGKKPGLNEDGALLAYNNHYTLCLMVDGHYQRDTTEVMINVLKKELEGNKTNWHFTGLDPDNINVNPKVYSMTISQRFFDLCKLYIKKIISLIREMQSRGEASFTIILYDSSHHQLHYYQVGDLILFMSHPDRHWGPHFQVGSRQFYEWINHTGIGGFHHGSLQARSGTRLILATDGLLDQPTFSMEEIAELFAIHPFTASRFVNYALKNNTPLEDDNITVLCLTL